jgi:Domain of unknown function (DUF6259)
MNSIYRKLNNKKVKMINSKLLIASAILLCNYSLLAEKLSFVEKKNGLSIKTATLKAGIENGIIVYLKDIKTGKVWAKRQINDTKIPVGLGVLYNLKTFRQGHIPWGETTLNQHLKPNFKLNNYFRPNFNSHFKLMRIKDKVKATWTGLSNGEKFLPKAKFSMIIGTDNSGALTVQTSGFNTQGKIFATLAPITNLDNEATYILPSFGGVGYSKAGIPALMPLYRPPFVEAPIMIAQNKHKSIAFWFENPRQRPFYQFLNRSGKSFAMIFENMALMPFEAHKKYTSPVLKINVFDGDWKAAATPYRNWYRNYYKKEIAIRDGVPWAKKIYTIIDSYIDAPKDEVIKKIAEIYPEGSVLYQNWNARAARHDHDFPDWTPRAKYVSGIERLHKYGIKTMAYTNTYCANYKSKAWNKDKLSSFFLTRKNSPYLYKGKSIDDVENPLNEKLIGTVDYTDSKDQFAKIKSGRLLYVDPLSSRWRSYHANMMKWWNTTTKTDANYEDTAGSVGDFGNGTIDAMSAAEGSVAQMRLLQKIQKDVPMATEYGPDAIAFASSWPLNYASFWGNDDFKRYRIHNQYPLAVYLYGYRQWVTAMLDSTDLRKHVQVSSSDACGGMGFTLVNYFRHKSIAELNENYSFRGHFFLRSKLFAAKSLNPYFPKGNYPDNIRCMYKGNDGIYSYYDDGKLQLMLGPDKKELYGRVFKASEVKTKLWLSNWPLQDGENIFGLNPANHYLLFIKPKNIPLPSITLDKLPKNILLTKYYDAPKFTYMEFDGKAKMLSLKLKLSQKFKEFYVNDKKVDIKNIKGKLPLRLLAVKKEARAEFTNDPLTRTISAGLMIGKAIPLRHKTKHTTSDQKLYWLSAKSAYVDYLVKVPAKDSAIEVYFQNLAPDSRHGCDASLIRILINGKEIKSYDTRSKNPAKKPKYLFDTKLHSWKAPVGKYAGKTILVTLVSDWKQSSNWDKMYIGIPCLTKSAKQKFEFKTW